MTGLNDKKAASCSRPLSPFIAYLPFASFLTESPGDYATVARHISFFRSILFVAPLTLYTNSGGTPNIKKSRFLELTVPLCERFVFSPPVLLLSLSHCFFDKSARSRPTCAAQLLLGRVPPPRLSLQPSTKIDPLQGL